MSDNNEELMGGFGISEDLSASNKIPFKSGIHVGFLTSVKGHRKTSKKGEEYDVLEFNFVDIKGEASFEKLEFAIKQGDAKFADKQKAMNIRIKHIYEAYKPFPTGGLGNGAKSWLEFFEIVAKGFNENGEGNTPIFKKDGKYIPVHLKFTYYNNQIGFPYSPNFIETVKEGRETLLRIDLQYDQMEQVQPKAKANSIGAVPGVFGGTSNNDFEEFGEK